MLIDNNQELLDKITQMVIGWAALSEHRQDKYADSVILDIIKLLKIDVSEIWQKGDR